MEATRRGNLVQQLRLFSGLVLFTYAAFHFFNLSLGLVSIDAMITFQDWRKLITRSTPGGIILFTALIIHPLLAISRLAFRSTLKMPAWEMVQIIFGLSIPAFLVSHIVDTRISFQIFGSDDNYRNVLGAIWPGGGWEKSLLLLLVWVHGCIGIDFWLRQSSAYRKIFLPLLVVAVIIPVLGIAGFSVAGRNVAIENAAITSSATIQDAKTNSENTERLEQIDDIILFTFYSMLALAGIIYGIGYVRRRYTSKINLNYSGGASVKTPPGPNLLEISRIHGIPHASVCGGRARCSTCRVYISRGIETLPPPDATEAATLKRVGAGPQVRLACQIHPKHSMNVALLLRPAGTSRITDTFLSGEAQGVEREMAVMFFDVRGFTALSADKLPYDVVFLLNQLFESVGAAILANGGWIDKYLGDGLMAVFGRNCDTKTACRQALEAARAIDFALDEVDEAWREETGQSIRAGIGIHSGPLVMGRIGENASAALTVIGSTVNAAARLEALSKEKSCQLIISAELGRIAQLDLGGFKRETATIRGLNKPVEIVIIPRARNLAHQGSS